MAGFAEESAFFLHRTKKQSPAPPGMTTKINYFRSMVSCKRFRAPILCVLRHFRAAVRIGPRNSRDSPDFSGGGARTGGRLLHFHFI
jgi:hypothetical protein